MADVYLLDDPLSAVDPHVGRHLFNECIGPKGCLAQQNATRILVTHQVHFLKDADWLVVLRNGKIEVQGSATDLYRSGVDFAAFIDTNEENNDENIEPEIVKRPSRNVSKVTLRSASTLSLYSEYDEFGGQNEFDDGSTGSLQVFEASSKGSVQGSLIGKYFQCGGSLLQLIGIIALFILAQCMTSGADNWIAFWTSQEEARENYAKQMMDLAANGTQSAAANVLLMPRLMSTDWCVAVFGAMLIGIFIVALTR